MATWDGSSPGRGGRGNPSAEGYHYVYSTPSHCRSTNDDHHTTSTTDNNPPSSRKSQPNGLLNLNHVLSTEHSGNSSIFFENNKPARNHSSAPRDNSRATRGRAFDQPLVSSSQLHPGANEFVPASRSSGESSKIFFPDNRKLEKKRPNVNYRQQNSDHQTYYPKKYDKPRKNHTPNYYSNYEAPQDYPKSPHDDLPNAYTRESPQGAYRGRKQRGNSTFHSSNYANTSQFTSEADSSPQSAPARFRNTSGYFNDPSEPYSPRSTEERHRETSSNSEYTAEDRYKKPKKKPRIKEAVYSDDPRDERYRSRRETNEEKSYKDRRSNYGDYPERERAKDEEKPVNWRQKPSQNTRKPKKFQVDDAASQKERLTEQLNRGCLECLVCCDYIRQLDAIWSCNNCYHVLHLKCVKKWAESSQSESGWRCPACQNVNLVIPEDYFCFCGKTRDPEWNRQDVAHSCGDICGRTRAKNNCPHRCTLLCHPGSCPMCVTLVTRSCGCGRTSQSLKCSTDVQLCCEAVCEKTLNCGLHQCQKKCHHDDCGACDKIVHQECFCGKHTRDVACLPDTKQTYECGEVCDKLLECGNHRCVDKCHPESCHQCSLKPEVVTHCCCGQTPLASPRESCLDPVPTCEKVCSKSLRCGQPSDPHSCKAPCHTAECPPCDATTWVKCRCGNMDREIPCVDLRTKADDARCEKKCVKKRSCGKHKCNQLCCIDIEHICPLPCSKTLSCGRHKCELTCHRGRCQPCYRSSFEELFCECGTAVIYPPVACGTRRPTCSRPCSRQHSCGHEVLHNCHSEPTCPPCTVLTQKWCYGKHELRKAVPCYYNDFSCGTPCGRPLSCGRHKCIALCHPGVCEKPGQVCVQACTTPRETCGHICAAPCHENKCPETPCKEMVKVTCACGHRSMTRACAENSREYQRIASGILASKMADMQLGHSVDLDEVFGQGAKKQNQLKTLECNEECKIIERNRKLALGLQIVNPDLSGKLMPRYSDFMKQWAKKDSKFCQMVHEKLSELVQLAKTSKQKSRSYSFDSMNREKRHFIHDYCEHFGCESQAYDQEPKRNVVATAVKDKCWLPSYSLLEMVQRENGQRKVPGPMLNTTKTHSLASRVSEVLPSTARKSQKLQPTHSSKSPDPEIDYFEIPSNKYYG